jgi:hypothetical protein
LTLHNEKPGVETGLASFTKPGLSYNFALTDEPPTFSAAHRVVINHGVQNVMRAAYRELVADDYVILWPPSLSEFTVA